MALIKHLQAREVTIRQEEVRRGSGAGMEKLFLLKKYVPIEMGTAFPFQPNKRLLLTGQWCARIGLGTTTVFR